jgi:hypothetical protein
MRRQRRIGEGFSLAGARGQSPRGLFRTNREGADKEAAETCEIREVKGAGNMGEERRQGAGLFLAALLITWMLALGGWAFLTALRRMEQTLSPEEYIVFSLEQAGEDLHLVLLNQEVTIPPPPEIPERLLPPRVRIFILAREEILNRFEDLLAGIF